MNRSFCSVIFSASVKLCQTNKVIGACVKKIKILGAILFAFQTLLQVRFFLLENLPYAYKKIQDNNIGTRGFRTTERWENIFLVRGQSIMIVHPLTFLVVGLYFRLPY
jgi:hypothetical protein